MKALHLIAAFLWSVSLVVAAGPRPAKTDYAKLKIEELAMRFRFPDRYMDTDRGEPAPRDMALGEMLRRKQLQLHVTKADVVFLLGKPEGDLTAAPDTALQWSYGMMGGTLVINFDKNGRVSEILEHHDGDPESAHTESLLEPSPNKTGQPGHSPAAKPADQPTGKDQSSAPAPKTAPR